MILSNVYDLWEWREAFPKDKTLVVTNGCFDILHAGHVQFLTDAKTLGDSLLVGVNSDESVRELKGPTRPVNPQQARAKVVDALKAVDATFVFDSTTSFLDLARPNVYTKAGDYTLETLDKHEVAVLRKRNAKIVLVGFLDGYSTTGIINKIK
jgi:D-glycero-beta-D-manno-heptose 1-phosphate adenylyltransferase